MDMHVVFNLSLPAVQLIISRAVNPVRRFLQVFHHGVIDGPGGFIHRHDVVDGGSHQDRSPLGILTLPAVRYPVSTDCFLNLQLWPFAQVTHLFFPVDRTALFVNNSLFFVHIPGIFVNLSLFFVDKRKGGFTPLAVARRYSILYEEAITLFYHIPGIFVNYTMSSKMRMKGHACKV